MCAGASCCGIEYGRVPKGDPPSHEPVGYRCPCCAIAAGAESEFTAWRDGHVLVQISLHWNPVTPARRW